MTCTRIKDKYALWKLDSACVGTLIPIPTRIGLRHHTARTMETFGFDSFCVCLFVVVFFFFTLSHLSRGVAPLAFPLTGRALSLNRTWHCCRRKTSAGGKGGESGRKTALKKSAHIFVLAFAIVCVCVHVQCGEGDSKSYVCCVRKNPFLTCP